MEHLQDALQDKSGLALLRPLSRKRKLNIVIPLLATGFIFFAVVVWFQTNPGSTNERTVARSTALPNAFDLYLEGMELMERWALDDNLDMSIDRFQQATTMDPNFALGFARLAEVLRIKYAFTGDSSWLDAALENSNEALSLNAGLAPVQVSLGRIQSTQGNYDLALASLERALSIDPNDALTNQALASLYHKRMISLQVALAYSSYPDELQDMINRGVGTVNTTPDAQRARRS